MSIYHDGFVRLQDQWKTMMVVLVVHLGVPFFRILLNFPHIVEATREKLLKDDSIRQAVIKDWYALLCCHLFLGTTLRHFETSFSSRIYFFK